MVCRSTFSRLPTVESKGFERGTAAAGTLLRKVSGAFEAVAPLQRPAGATSPRWNLKDSRRRQTHWFAGRLLADCRRSNPMDSSAAPALPETALCAGFGAYYLCALICSPCFLVLQGFSASVSLLTLSTDGVRMEPASPGTPAGTAFSPA